MNGKIKKRNGEIVEFAADKITIAIRKAYEATGTAVSEEKIGALTDDIIAQMEHGFPQATPSVEDVQNIVEQTVMRAGDFEVAKAYIIYRYEHTKVREEKKKDILEKIERNDLFVVKRSGKQEKFSPRKIKKTLTFAAHGFEDVVDIDLLVKQSETNLYDGITTKEIARAVEMATRSFIERDAAYAKVAARLLIDELYKEAIGAEVIDYKELDTQYRQAFVENIKRGVQVGRLDPRLLQYDLEKISSYLKPERDDLFAYLGAQTLRSNYFVINPETKQILETPQAFWMRVALGIALNESDDLRFRYVQQFYDMISTFRFVPSSPTLYHAGTHLPQLSSCYLTTIEDSLDHIFKCIGDNAQLSKWAGGVANDWTSLRGMGALIKGTGVESQGVVPFLKIANDTTVAINRSGRRRGATCAYLETWHYDIEDFMELRKNTGDDRRRTHDMNTANWIPDLFMKRVRDDQEWTLFSPDEVEDLHHLYGKAFDRRYEHYEKMAKEGKIRMYRTIRAKDLWKRMIMMLFETGHPWMTWKDASNVRSPQDHAGVVHSSNLCTEITLNTSVDETAVCNLGWINLARHVTKGELDTEKVQETVTVGMRMLDNVIDLNFYPTVEAKTSNLKHRPVGFGVGGFQDALYQLNINFDSDECVTFADECQDLISYHSIMASSELSKERGPYKSYRGSKWERGIFPVDTLDELEKERGEKIAVSRAGKLDWQPVREHVKKYGMRNSNCMAIAPTASTSNIVGSFPTIEPIYKNVYVKSNMSGEFIIVNPYLVDDLKKRGLWSVELLEEIKGADGSIARIDSIPEVLKDKYKEVFEIEPEWLIKAAAHRGKWIDQSQSLNLFYDGTSGKEISDMYLYAWSMGLKTTYYLRTLGATGVEKSTLDLSKQKTLSGNTKHDLGNAHTPVAPKPEEKMQGVPLPLPKKEMPVPVPLPTPVKEPVAVAATTNTINSTIKLCKLNDPECEACQ